MPIFHAIAAMSENRVIGDHGKIPWHLPEDFRWFKHKTIGGTLIMGRKTFESIGKPLPGRETRVLSRSTQDFQGVKSYDAIETITHGLAPNQTIWFCGGEELYRQTLPLCSVLYLTRVKRIVGGDAFMPRFEDDFFRQNIIHQTAEFSVEHWLNKNASHKAEPPESWPFLSTTT